MSTLATTPRLLVRALVDSDSEAVFEYRALPEVSRYQFWGPRSVDEVRARVASMPDAATATPGEWVAFGLTLRDTGQLIGDCCYRITLAESQTAEIGITLAPAFQGRGFASEAVRALLGHLFDTREFHRVIASVDPRNAASIALLGRIGMRQEAHFRESCWFKGTWVDDVIFAVLRREWAEGAGRT